jgi:hypothetical protein
VSVPQQVLIETIRQRCEQLDERYPGYVKDLIGYLAEILAIERAHDRNVVQQVESQLEAFGELYGRRTSESANS